MNNLGSGADDLGLIYMNARYYVSGIGRFASADTIVPDPTNPQSLNRYSYVLNAPVNFTDSTGHYVDQGGDTGGLPCPDTSAGLSCGAMYLGAMGVSTGSATSPEMEQVTASAAAMTPYLDTGDDVATLFTGCGYLCQMGYEAPLGWGWRTVAGIGIAAPFGVRSVRTLSGFLDETFDGGSNIVYRALREDDRLNIAEGLFGKSWPADEVEPISHVAGAHHTPWISTGTVYDRIKDVFDSGNGIAVIDLSKVDSTIVDYSNGIPGYEGTMLSNWTKQFGEKLVKDYIPPEAIITVID